MTASFLLFTWGKDAQGVRCCHLTEQRRWSVQCLTSNAPSPLVSIVMGIPSVKREVHSYLTDTLSSLMSELSTAEKEDCVIVVLIAEVSGHVFVCPDVSSQAF